MFPASTPKKGLFRQIPIHSADSDLKKDRLTAFIVVLIVLIMFALMVILASFGDPSNVQPFHGPMM